MSVVSEEKGFRVVSGLFASSVNIGYFI